VAVEVMAAKTMPVVTAPISDVEPNAAHDHPEHRHRDPCQLEEADINPSCAFVSAGVSPASHCADV
jgi:hypothetical protein